VFLQSPSQAKCRDYVTLCQRTLALTWHCRAMCVFAQSYLTLFGKRFNTIAAHSQKLRMSGASYRNDETLICNKWDCALQALTLNGKFLSFGDALKNCLYVVNMVAFRSRSPITVARIVIVILNSEVPALRCSPKKIEHGANVGFSEHAIAQTM